MRCREGTITTGTFVKCRDIEKAMRKLADKRKIVENYKKTVLKTYQLRGNDAVCKFRCVSSRLVKTRKFRDFNLEESFYGLSLNV